MRLHEMLKLTKAGDYQALFEEIPEDVLIPKLLAVAVAAWKANGEPSVAGVTWTPRYPFLTKALQELEKD